MKKEYIFQKIALLIASMLEVEVESITVDTSLIDNFVMDSIQLIEFILQIEDEFQIVFNPDIIDTNTFEKLSLLVDYIYESIMKKE